MIPLIITSSIAIVLLLVIIFINNNLITKKNYVEQALKSIDVYLKKRNDLIPNLIAVVKKYTDHEASVLTKITELRKKSTEQVAQQNLDVHTEQQMTKALSTLQVQVENYPDLKADKQYTNLQYALYDIEDQLSASRRAFNAAVTDYNNGIEMFPNNLIAGMKSYKAKQLFEIEESERANVNVKDLLNN